MTYSFGSISFGSLIVALINMLRQAVSIAQQQEAQSGNIAASIAFCVLGCFIGILDWAVQFINRYAFSYIALYGKAYIPAAKDTWKYVTPLLSMSTLLPASNRIIDTVHRMMKDRGIDALVNDCLIGPVLTMGSTASAFLCTFLAYLYLKFTDPAYNSGGKFTPVIMAYAFLIGLQVAQIFLTPIGSGVEFVPPPPFCIFGCTSLTPPFSTFFVAAAWDPEGECYNPCNMASAPPADRCV